MTWFHIRKSEGLDYSVYKQSDIHPHAQHPDLYISTIRAAEETGAASDVEESHL